MPQTMPQTAKIFNKGRSQAVRLPVEFRFSEPEVYIRRDSATGDVILSRRPGTWAEILAKLDHGAVPKDFLTDVERDRRLPQDRPGLFSETSE